MKWSIQPFRLLKRNLQNGGNLCRIKYFFIIRKNSVFLFRHLFYSLQKNWSPEEQALIILHPKLGQMVNGIVLPIKKVFGLVDSKISVEIKDEGRKPVSYTHLRAHETDSYLVCRLLLEKKKKTLSI